MSVSTFVKTADLLKSNEALKHEITQRKPLEQALSGSNLARRFGSWVNCSGSTFMATSRLRFVSLARRGLTAMEQLLGDKAEDQHRIVMINFGVMNELIGRFPKDSF